MKLRPIASPRGAIVSAAFGPVLRRLRQKAGKSQASFADHAGMDRTFISQIERGIRQPTLAMFMVIARGLDIDPVCLMSLTLKELKSRSPKFLDSP
jgi:transcriptional regulator with XRE-family HTH domain